MEKYQNELKRQLVFSIIAIVITLIAILVYIGLFHVNPINDFSKGFQFGILVTLVIYVVSWIVSIILQMKNPDYARKKYIKKNDDREKLIIYKTVTSTFYTITYLLLISMVISLYFDMVIFYTLLAVTYADLFIFVFFKFIYKRIL